MESEHPWVQLPGLHLCASVCSSAKWGLIHPTHPDKLQGMRDTGLKEIGCFHRQSGGQMQGGIQLPWGCVTEGLTLGMRRLGEGAGKRQ